MRIRNCLTASGFRAKAASVPTRDRDAPDYAVFYHRGEETTGGGEIGIYETKAEASEKLGRIESDAKSSGVVVERHGLATVIYFQNPPEDLQVAVRGCLARANAP